MNSDNQLPDNQGAENAEQLDCKSERIENVLNEEQRLYLLRRALRVNGRPTLPGPERHMISQQLREWQAELVVSFALPIATIIAEYSRMFGEERGRMTRDMLPKISVIDGTRFLNNGLGRRCEIRDSEVINLLDLAAVDDRIEYELDVNAEAWEFW